MFLSRIILNLRVALRRTLALRGSSSVLNGLATDRIPRERRKARSSHSKMGSQSRDYLPSSRERIAPTEENHMRRRRFSPRVWRRREPTVQTFSGMFFVGFLCKIDVESTRPSVQHTRVRACVWHTRATTCGNVRFARNARVSRESANDKQLVPTISTGSAGDIRDASIVPRIITRLFAARSIHLRA